MMKQEPDVGKIHNEELRGIWVVLFWIATGVMLGGAALYSLEPTTAAFVIGGILGGAAGFGVSWYASQPLPLAGLLRFIPSLVRPKPGFRRRR